MTKISSSMTWFYKKVFPTFWFGFLGLFLLIGAFGGAGEASVMFLVVPVLMAVFGYFLLKHLIWDLVDEVYDGGDYLLVRNRDEECRISVSEIMNVNASMNVNPPRITLRLASPCKFGSEVSFSPPAGWRLNPFAKNKIAEDLLVRVDRARGGRR